MARRNRKLAYLQNAGFLDFEIKELRTRTWYALRTPPYLRRMIASRRGIKMNSIRYDWSPERYREAIVKEYTKRGLDPRAEYALWHLVRWYEEQTVRRGEEYESPWRKRLKRGKSKQLKHRVTKKSYAQSRISELNRQIDRTSNPQKKAELVAKRNEWWNQLNK